MTGFQLKELQDADTFSGTEVREAQSPEGRQNGEHWRNLNPLAPTATTNSKYNPTPSQVNEHKAPHHRSAYLTSYYLIHHAWLSIKTCEACQKARKTTNL